MSASSAIVSLDCLDCIVQEQSKVAPENCQQLWKATINECWHSLCGAHTVLSKYVCIEEGKCVLEQFRLLDVKQPVSDKTWCNCSNNTITLCNFCLVSIHSERILRVENVVGGEGNMWVQRGRVVLTYKRPVTQATGQQHRCQGDVMICNTHHYHLLNITTSTNEGGHVFIAVRMFCLTVSKITQKVLYGFRWNLIVIVFGNQDLRTNDIDGWVLLTCGNKPAIGYGSWTDGYVHPRKNRVVSVVVETQAAVEIATL